MRQCFRASRIKSRIAPRIEIGFVRVVPARYRLQSSSRSRCTASLSGFLDFSHTPSHGERPVFGGRGVGIGFSGTYDGEGAECEATALAGKRSIRFRAVLPKLVAA
jgi:hypothetical protein